MPLADGLRAERDRLSLLQVRAWTARGIWAAMDQGLFAISNFLIHVMLARTLSTSDYGAFVASYAMLIAVAVIHGGLLTDPMVVFGADRYGPWLADYVRLVRRYHKAVTAMAVLVLATIAAIVAFCGYSSIAIAIAGMALALPFILLSWLARRACYTVARADWAAMTSFLYCATVVGGLFVLHRAGMVSGFAAQTLMAAAGAVAAWPAFFMIGRLPTQPMPAAMAIQARADHWAYGRWYSGAQMLSWLTGYGWYLIVPVWGGLEASAALRALLNLLLPIQHVDVAMNSLLVPSFVRTRSNVARFWWVVRASCVLFALEGLAYGTMLLMFGGPLMTLLYDGRYVADPRVLALAASLPLFGSVTSVLTAALDANGHPQVVFRGRLVAAAVVGLLGLWMTAAWGVAGAVAGMVCAALAQGTVLALAVWQLYKRTTTTGEAASIAGFPIPGSINSSR